MAAIILLGAFLRLYQLDLVNVDDYDPTSFNLALAWLDEGRLPLVGRGSSTDVARPAGMSYLLAPLLLASQHPLVTTAFMALLNVLSIPLCYRLVKAYFGLHAALLAALLYASGFWAAAVSRNTWDMAPMAPLALLVLDRLLATTVRRQPSALGWAIFWTALAVAVHPAAIGLAAAVAVAALLLRVPLRQRQVLPGLLAAAIVWAPFAWHLARTDWRDLRLAQARGTAPAETDLRVLGYALEQLFPHPAHRLFQSPQGPAIPASVMLGLASAAFTVGFVLSLSWCAGRGWRALREPGGPGTAHLTLALAFLVPVAVFVVRPFPVYAHYSYPLLPYGSIILGLGLTSAARATTRLLRFRGVGGGRLDLGVQAGASIVVLVLALAQAWVLLALLQWTAQNGATPVGGVPLRFTLEALGAAGRARAAPEDAITVASTAGQRELWDLLARPQEPASFLNHSSTLAFPALDGRPIVYLTTADESRAGAFLRQGFLENQQLVVRYSALPDHFRVFALSPEAGLRAQSAVIRRRGPWDLSNGIRLEGLGVEEEPRAGEDLSVTLAWTVASASPDRSAGQRLFVHLVDRKGRKWAEANELDYPPDRWRAGDRVISWLRIPLPRDAPLGLYAIRLGMFNAVVMEPVKRADGDAFEVEVGTLRVEPRYPPPAPQRVLAPPVRFGGALELLGYDLPASVAAGGALDLRLLWRAVQTPATNYTLFVHLLDQGGQLVAQEDGFPAGGLYPTSAWRPGEVVEDQHRVPLPPSAAGQRLTVALGWYRLDTGQRLTLDGSTQSVLRLEPVAVAP